MLQQQLTKKERKELKMKNLQYKRQNLITKQKFYLYDLEDRMMKELGYQNS